MKKIEISEQNLKEILDYDELLILFKSFSILTGIDVSLHDVKGEEKLSYRINKEYCICEMIDDDSHNEICKDTMKKAGEKSAELGEPYIFNCGCVVKCSAPIIFEEKLIGSISCGPVLLWEPDEIAKEEMRKFIIDRSIPLHKLNDIIFYMKQLECDNMTSAANMLYLVVNYICKEESKYLTQSKKISIQQKQIAELLIEKKQSHYKMIKERKFKNFSIQMEKELIAYVQTGDKNNAKRILNDMLGEIFSFSSGDLDIIKAKLYELTAILMRAAVDVGVPLENMMHYINYYNKILAQDTTFEDLCYMTSEIMEFFMAIVYKYRSEKKTNKHLVKAINYIKENYKNEISLTVVADAIYLNNYYLSHLFREEMDMTFSDYLNKIRMEESLNLMKVTSLKIQEIAESVGFKDANYFTKAFKKYYGVSPKRYLQIYN